MDLLYVMPPRDEEYCPEEFTAHGIITKQLAAENDGLWAAVEPEEESDKDELYHSLDSEKHEVRMCTLDAESKDISCTLFTTSLGNADDYMCLSYVWGDPNRCTDIHINNLESDFERLHTVSLCTALRSLKQKLRGRRIWIDAVCINQKDENEKASQEPLMTELYTNAAEVWIWLGDSGRYDNYDPEEMVAGASQDDGYAATEDLLRYLQSDIHFHELPYFSKCCSECPSHEGEAPKPWRKAFDSLSKIMETQWFERTWTIQEIVLAKRATAFYDGWPIEWSLMENAMMAWNEHFNACCSGCMFSLGSRDFNAMHRYAGQILDLIKAKQCRLQVGDEGSILRPLLKFRSKKVSDHRDKIYGLLGLQSEYNKILIQPDYGGSCSELFVRFAQKLTECHGWAVTLHLELSHNYPGLPSWVPDWTFYTLDPSDYAIRQFFSSLDHNCSAGLEGNVQIQSRCLEIHGIEIDCIDHLSHAYRLSGDLVTQMSLISEWFDFIEVNKNKASKYDGHVKVKDAFYHSMFAGRLYEGYEGHKEEGRPLQIDDIRDWKSRLNNIAQQLRQKGPEITLTMDHKRSSQTIGSLRQELFVTKEGYVGVCPETCRIGDRAFALYSCKAPIFLRPIREGQMSLNRSYTVLGHGYIHGLMDGEVLRLERGVKEVCIL